MQTINYAIVLAEATEIPSEFFSGLVQENFAVWCVL